ncbi:hypothetical protein ACHQM5_025107 [Ranunculus cassubicifolius]
MSSDRFHSYMDWQAFVRDPSVRALCIDRVSIWFLVGTLNLTSLRSIGDLDTIETTLFALLGGKREVSRCQGMDDDAYLRSFLSICSPQMCYQNWLSWDTRKIYDRHPMSEDMRNRNIIRDYTKGSQPKSEQTELSKSSGVYGSYSTQLVLSTMSISTIHYPARIQGYGVFTLPCIRRELAQVDLGWNTVSMCLLNCSLGHGMRSLRVNCEVLSA